MKEREYMIELPVFNYMIFVVVTDNIAESRKNRKARLGCLKKDISKYVDGMHSFDNLEPNGWVFINPTSSPGVIAHEVFHALWRMFKWVGAKLENETVAYHLSYIVDKIHTHMLPKQKKK